MELKISIAKLQSGNELEFKRLYQLYFPHFLSFALHYVKDEEVCRDLIQDVFIAYWEKHEHFSDIVSLKVYLYRSIRNKCLNELRVSHANNHERLDGLQEIMSGDFLEENIIREELALIVRQKIADLNPQAQKIVRFSIQGKTNREIADLLSISINTVKTHKKNIYSILRLQLRDLQMLLQLLKII
jgi:RNA polymerase sigma-70 factor (family 1)